MPDDPQLTDAEEGKKVVTPDGEEIGKITGVHDNVASVEPDPELTDQIRSALGWERQGLDTETHRLQGSDVSRVTDDTVVIQDDIE